MAIIEEGNITEDMKKEKSTHQDGGAVQGVEVGVEAERGALDIPEMKGAIGRNQESEFLLLS